MAVGNLVKNLQNIMWKDAGVNGDAQRIEQMVWLLFLKVYDSIEEEWEYNAEEEGYEYSSIIPEELRWKNWAHSKDEDDKEMNNVLTGDELLDFIDNRLFPVLKGKTISYSKWVDKDYELKRNETFEEVKEGLKNELNPTGGSGKKKVKVTIKGIKVTSETKRGKAIVQDVFMEVNQYMKNGVLLRQMINVIDEIDLLDSNEAHQFGVIYETILKDLQNAGHAGEFYTPRALTDFIIEMLNPQLGEKVGDFAMGTGGFLISALQYLFKQVGDDAANFELFQKSLIGQEWKPFPYLLAATNLMLHGIKNPEIYHMDSLGRQMSEYQTKGKVNVIAMNPPYGGSTDATTKLNFKKEYQSSETADLFIALIMQRLDKGGRAGVVVPDGFLFGTDNAKLAIKTNLLRNFNLHTIIRLPGSIFSPYTSIATNVLFFNNEKADGAEEGFKTKDVWFYRMDMPEGYKHFNKTRPMKLEHCAPIRDWWNDRKEDVSEDGTVEKARCFDAKALLEGGLNFDQCKIPKEEEEILSPKDLLMQYHEKRNALNAQIDRTLDEIQSLLGLEL